MSSKGGQGVVRMNVSVPKELKIKMGRTVGRINWSAVAQAAFEARLASPERASADTSQGFVRSQADCDP